MNFILSERFTNLKRCYTAVYAMTKYLLSQWKAIELFCKVVCKYEILQKEGGNNSGLNKQTSLKVSDFQNNNLLLQTLRKYESPNYYRPFGDIYMKQIAEKEGISRHYPKALYDLSLEIRFSEPVVRTLDELLLLLIFIGERSSLTNFTALEEWRPSDRQRKFENSRWWLYYYEQYVDPENQTEVVGLTRAVVHLKPFAELVINNIDASEGLPGKLGTYNGQYSIYGRTGKHLLLQGRLGNDQARDLHILLHIGDEEFDAGEIALGQFHNVNDTIYSGTIILEKVSQRGSLRPAFFEAGDSQIDSVYWDFFKEKHKNRIRVKSDMKSKGKLRVWIDKKRRKEENKGK
ncbi:hypothetical protein [Fibrivirga algicola]|uniref:Uncharacterized protein n=1 Tax=Fibrivirga algicola TaxID=2950420 RepID=A0ABX0QMZ9_9BACT|nr:hypothetical protein [Fibrivirga algicola]NID13501.1 hypothetical protein [Fibrivirga algicola]